MDLCVRDYYLNGKTSLLNIRYLLFLFSFIIIIIITIFFFCKPGLGEGI